MRPGGTASTGTVDIGNTGSLSGAFTLTRGTPVDSDSTNPLSAKLNVKVVDCGTVRRRHARRPATSATPSSTRARWPR